MRYLLLLLCVGCAHLHRELPGDPEPVPIAEYQSVYGSGGIMPGSAVQKTLLGQSVRLDGPGSSSSAPTFTSGTIVDGCTFTSGNMVCTGGVTGATVSASGAGTSSFASLTFQLSNALAGVFFSGSGPQTIESNTTDANTSATVPAVWFKTDVNITDTDLAYAYKDSGNTLRWGWTELGKTYNPANGGTCTLNGGTPSTCTVTVTASAVCQCTPVGATAAIAAAGCAVGLSGTTLTATSGATLANNVNILCDR